jgi:hypothetical protein
MPAISQPNWLKSCQTFQPVKPRQTRPGNVKPTSILN